MTDETWNLAAPPCHPLELAGRLVQEDLCIIQTGDDGPPRFTAAVLCFPSRWRLHEKLGHPLATVHGPVPFYAERLATPVDRFMAEGEAGPHRIAPQLVGAGRSGDVPTDGQVARGDNSAITADNAGDTLYLRVERQTLRACPGRRHPVRHPRAQLSARPAITTPAIAARLAEAVRALPEATVHYKSLRSFGSALLAWLDARSQ